MQKFTPRQAQLDVLRLAIWRLQHLRQRWIKGSGGSKPREVPCSARRRYGGVRRRLSRLS